MLPSSFSLAAAAAAKTTAAKLEPELIEGPAGTPKVFTAARGDQWYIESQVGYNTSLAEI